MLAGGRGSGRGHGPGRVRGEEGKQAEAVLRRKPGPVQLRIDHYMVAVRPNGHQGAGAGAGPGDGSPVRFTGEANSRPGYHAEDGEAAAASAIQEPLQLPMAPCHTPSSHHQKVPCAGLEALALSSGGRLKGGRSGTCMPGLLILDGTPDEVPDSCADEDDAYWLPGKTYAGIAATRAQKKVVMDVPGFRNIMSHEEEARAATQELQERVKNLEQRNDELDGQNFCLVEENAKLKIINKRLAQQVFDLKCEKKQKPTTPNMPSRC